MPLVLSPSPHSASTPTPTTATHTLSLHDALPIYLQEDGARGLRRQASAWTDLTADADADDAFRLCFRLVPPIDTESKAKDEDRKSTRLNSSHRCISYAVFCLKKKKKKS